MSLYLGNSPIANTGYDKANQDLSNLTSQGQNIANWSSNVTNCITEIPQDIKLELSDGTLTLKAGSKVYVPNGAGVFDTLTTTSDINITPTGGSGKVFVCIGGAGTSGASSVIANCVSGAGVTPINYGMTYDTTTNIITRYGGSGSITYDKASFPLALCSQTDGVITSIDQVFNGFGYIGSTVFALPGVKGLIPNGRNADGSLKNIGITTSTVTTFTYTDNNPYTIYSGINAIGVVTLNGARTYNEEENIIYNSGGNANYVEFATYINPNGKISNWTPKTVFHALDYNDSSTISSWAMPSSRYIDLAIGAHGTNYTAPANGWFAIKGYAVSGAVLWIAVNDLYMQAGATYSSSSKGGAIVPCKKGDRVQIGYYGGALDYVRFIYAEGEN